MMLPGLRRCRGLMVAAVVVLMVAAGLHAMTDPRAAEAATNCPTAAPDAASAVVRARACGSRVEVLAQRSERAQVFANANGTFTLESSATPRRVRNADGTWSSVDTRLRREPGLVRPAATVVDLAFNRGGAGPMARAGIREADLSLTAPWPLPAPVLDGSTAAYREVLPGVDLVLVAKPQGFSTTLVARTRESLAGLRTISFGVDASGLSIKPDGAGFAAVDKGGDAVFRIPAPKMWDSSGASTADAPRVPDAAVQGDRVAGVAATLANGRLRLAPDRALLDDPVAMLPLAVNVQIPLNRQDYAMISHGFPDEEYYNFDGKVDEGMGLCDVQTDGTCNRDQIKRLAWEFDLPPQVHGTHVLAATFKAFEANAYDCTPDWVQLWVTGGISPATNWTNHNGSWQSKIAEVNIARRPGCATPPDWVDFNAKDVAEDAAEGRWFTIAVGLRAANEGSMAGGWKRFRYDAQLIITYNTLPPVPDELTSVGTSQRLSCATPGRLNATSGVGLSATVRDVDAGSAVKAQYEWQDATVGTPVTALPDTPFATPPHTFEAALPASSLPDGHTVRWRVKGHDGTDESTFTPWCEFVVDNATPGQPTITAPDLPAFPAPPPATTRIGTPALVTLTPAIGDTDIIGFYYGVGSVEPIPTIWVPASLGGTATIPVVPVVSGLAKNFLTVVAVDEAGNRSPVPPTAPNAPGTRQFRANAAATAARVPGDATGDGRADVTVLNGSGAATLWRWDAAAGGGLMPPVAVQGVETTYPAATTRSVTGDFDGDRLSDVAVFIQDGGGVRLSVQRSSGNGLFGAPAQVLPGWNVANMKVTAANFDGDATGRDDIGVAYNDGNLVFSLRILVANGSVGVPTFANPATWYTSPQGAANWADMKVFAGDLDGDGRGDIGHFYQYPSCQTKLWAHYSTGSAFGGGVLLWDSLAPNWCWESTDQLAADFDGDGRADVAAFYRFGGCLTALFLFHSNADRTMTREPFEWFSTPGAWCGDRAQTSAGDHDGDGRADLAAVYRCCAGNQVKVYTFTSTGRAFQPPALRYAGALGPAGVRSNANLLIGAGGTASSVAAGWPVSTATDGAWGGIGFSTWSNVNVNHTEWLELTLPDPGEVNRLVLYPRGNAPYAGQGFPADFTVDVFDGSSWVTVLTRTGHPAPTTGGPLVFDFPARTAHRIRITGTSLRIVVNAYVMQFAEVEAYRV